MSDYSATSARPVSLFTIVFLLVLFAAFLLVVRYFYHPAEAMPQIIAAENVPEDFEWRASREARRQTLLELRKAQAEQVSSYRWIDQDAGKVQLPIERAMELTAQQYGARK